MLAWPWEEATNPAPIFHAAMIMLLTQNMLNPGQCAGRGLCARSRTENPRQTQVSGGHGPLVLMPLSFSIDCCFELLWAKPGCLSCGFTPAGCLALPCLLLRWPASCRPACALSHPSVPAPAFLQ